MLSCAAISFNKNIEKKKLTQFDMESSYLKSLVPCLSPCTCHRLPLCGWSLQTDWRLTAAMHKNKTTVSPGCLWQFEILKLATVRGSHMELLDEGLLATCCTPSATLLWSKTPMCVRERRSVRERERERGREVCEKEKERGKRVN